MRTLDAMLLLFTSIDCVLSIPYSIPPPPKRPPVPFDPFQLQQPPRPHPPPPSRELNPFSNLVIPKCALSCYIDAIPGDGCALEIDIKCHCSTGNVLGKAEACVETACSKADQEDAKRKIARACQAVGINPSVPSGPSSTSVGSASTSSRVTSTGLAATPSTPPVSTATSISTPTSTEAAPPTSNDQPSDPPSSSSTTPTTAALASTTHSQTAPESSASSPTPTDNFLAAPASQRTLSGGAKAGISVSVLFVASAAFLALSLYIRRLKRQLALAKAAADVPDSVLRSASHRNSTHSALFASSRRRSWPSAPRGRGFSRRDSAYTSESPVSPLSPVFFRDGHGGRRASIAEIIKRTRGNALSVVLERDDEDASSLMSRGRSMSAREPVPGQSEGLVGPLEMDGELAAIFEAPTSITPRERSKERNGGGEWKEYDFGKF